MTALARKTDIDTSHDAAKGLELTTLQTEVFAAFKRKGPMTDSDLNDHFFYDLNRSYAESTVRKRRSELTAMGKIKDTGKREGRHAVWALA